MQNISRTREESPEQHDRGKDLQPRVIDFNERFSQIWRILKDVLKSECMYIYIYIYEEREGFFSCRIRGNSYCARASLRIVNTTVRN